MQFPSIVLTKTLTSVKEVQRWIQSRLEAILDEEDENTFLYWWSQAGLPDEALAQEAIHNTLAFSTWTGVISLTILAKTTGVVGLTSDVSSPQTFDFFSEYDDAGTDAERLDVVRETYRLIQATPIWLSRRESASTDLSLEYDDPNYDHSATAFDPLLIQVLNDPNAYTYSAPGSGRYEDLTGATCPFLQSTLSKDDFATSSVDFETMIPTGHEKIIQVYDQPKYAPFGIGYRRCAGEVLNYMFMDELLSGFGGLEFEIRGDPVDYAYIAGGVSNTDPQFDTAIPTALIRRLDNLYVVADLDESSDSSDSSD